MGNGLQTGSQALLVLGVSLYTSSGTGWNLVYQQQPGIADLNLYHYIVFIYIYFVLTLDSDTRKSVDKGPRTWVDKMKLSV